MRVRVVLAGMLGILGVGMSVIREFKILHVVVCISDVFLDIDINITKVRPIYGDVLPVWGRLLTMLGVELVMVTRVMITSFHTRLPGLPRLLLGEGALQHGAGGGAGAGGGGLRRGEGAGAGLGLSRAARGGSRGEELSVVRHLVHRGHQTLRPAWPGRVVRAGVAGGLAGDGRQGGPGGHVGVATSPGEMFPVGAHQRRVGERRIVVEWWPGVGEPVGSEVGRHPRVR